MGEKYDGLLLMDTDARALDEHMPHLFPNKTRKAALDARAHPLCTSIWSLSGTSSTAAGGGERARHPGRYAPHPYGGGGGGAWGGGPVKGAGGGGMLSAASKDGGGGMWSAASKDGGGGPWSWSEAARARRSCSSSSSPSPPIAGKGGGAAELPPE